VEPADPAPQPGEAAMSHEEEALLWRTLQRLPPNYRESLILFYREGRSIERVAHDLDLSVDAVKQRLSRGRTLLKNQLTAVIEGTLSGTIPKKAFTLGVIAALPALTATASAATLTASATKTTATLAGSGAVLGLLGGILGGWLGAKASIENTHSLRERKFMVRLTWIVVLLVLAFLGGLFSVIHIGKPLASTRPGLFAAMIIGLVGLYILLLMALVFWGNHRQRRIRIEDGTLPVSSPSGPPAGVSNNRLSSGYEFVSRRRLLGLPLIHINFGVTQDGRQKRARGWIAMGNVACGVVLAIGNLAAGGIALGGLSLGVVSVSGLAAGLLAVGGVAVGGWVIGGFAIGLQALGGLALAWQAAFGGLAVAFDYARGGLAIAEHANDPAADEFMRTRSFMSVGTRLMEYSRWALILPAALILVLLFGQRSRTSSPPPH
ncbi:MAG TPA: sigma-70 family RNA polymerase sigma factor, partial [Methylomirabilota bacterium]|nr:sigma-70 family RNA polymerase sigma factor [Methylomirabilota bacterium]